MRVEPKAVRALPSKARQTLSVYRRIRQRTEFEQAFRAECLTNKWFAVYVRKNQSGFARLGIVASKRTMPKAVSRNLAKRLIREAFRRGFSAGCALDVVVRVKRQINPENSTEGRLALVQLLQAVQV
ncbi:MAG: ribonuclease P protein component [Nitrosomonadales bacterium]|nr:ribonuclease P protein component [Nitrosomonadales bacterium]